MDVISFEFPDWHFNVRPSNTEPLLRLNLEALDEDTMAARRDEVLDLIRSP
jgi:phosphomannomutase